MLQSKLPDWNEKSLPVMYSKSPMLQCRAAWHIPDVPPYLAAINCVYSPNSSKLMGYLSNLSTNSAFLASQHLHCPGCRWWDLTLVAFHYHFPTLLCLSPTRTKALWQKLMDNKFLTLTTFKQMKHSQIQLVFFQTPIIDNSMKINHVKCCTYIKYINHIKSYSVPHIPVVRPSFLLSSIVPTRSTVPPISEKKKCPPSLLCAGHGAFWRPLRPRACEYTKYLRICHVIHTCLYNI